MTCVHALATYQPEHCADAYVPSRRFGITAKETCFGNQRAGNWSLCLLSWQGMFECSARTDASALRGTSTACSDGVSRQGLRERAAAYECHYFYSDRVLLDNMNRWFHNREMGWIDGWRMDDGLYSGACCDNTVKDTGLGARTLSRRSDTTVSSTTRHTTASLTPEVTR